MYKCIYYTTQKIFYITLMLLYVFHYLSFASVQPKTGLSTSFGEVFMNDLQIGKTYSTNKSKNIPLKVTNTGSSAVSIKIEVLIPQASELKDGYEPIPDISWIKLEKKAFVLDSNGFAETDVIISIPKKKKYQGKKYQVYLWSHTISGTSYIAVGLRSRLLISTAPKKIKVKKPAIKNRNVQKKNNSIANTIKGK